jgi:cytochrome c biogenesis protein CcmG/thiol:disulfide interchange protein DsbE
MEGERSDPDDRPGPLRPRIGRLSLVFVAAVAIGLVSAFAGGGSGEESPAEAVDREPAPAIVFETFDGETWRLSEHLSEDGRPVVLNLWASWCPPCRREIPEISAFADAHPEVFVVGVAVDDRFEDALELATELQPTYLVGFDTTGVVRAHYPSFGLPVTHIIDGDGRIVRTLDGIVDRVRLEEALEGV